MLIARFSRSSCFFFRFTNVAVRMCPSSLSPMSRNTRAYDLAEAFMVQTVLDPRETRGWLADMLDMHERRLTNGVGEHLMRTWPTTF